VPSHYTKLLRTTLTASLFLVAIAGAAVAGPFEDAVTAYDNGDYATAIRLLRPLADQGLAEAQHDLAIMYFEGQGVSRDYAEAMKWFRLAAAQGNAQAQYNVGLMYARGQGVAPDCQSAFKFGSDAILVQLIHSAPINLA